MAKNEWNAEQWQAWRENNIRLLSEGYTLHTHMMVDGGVKEFATKDGITVDRTPDPWKEHIND